LPRLSQAVSYISLVGGRSERRPYGRFRARSFDFQSEGHIGRKRFNPEDAHCTAGRIKMGAGQ